MKKQISSAVLALFALFLAQSPTAAQQYPSKPVQLVIGFGPGGASDLIARVIAEPLSQKLGKPIIPENRPGAGGMIGAASVATASPDGYVLLFGGDSQVASKYLYKNLTFDPQMDLIPVVLVIASEGYALLGSPQFPARTLTEFLALVRANPGKFTYSSPGIGSGPQIAFEMIKSAANLDILHVPFKSGNEMLAAVMRDETQFTLHSLAVASQNAGRVTALGTTGEARSQILPDTPTFREAGIDITAATWFAIFAPAKTPRPIVEKLNQVVNDVLVLPDVTAAYGKMGYTPRPQTLQQFEAFYTAEFPKFKDAVTKANISAQ
jgi:tripartite-type tricarboxylate transporter receptor subunit TctC